MKTGATLSSLARNTFRFNSLPHQLSSTLASACRVRNMTKQDLQTVTRWAKDLQWNPGQYEVEPLYAADPTGYWVLERDDGQLIASLAGVKHSRSFAFLGLYIVDQKFRGQGYGKLLWDAVLANLKNHSTVALNGVIDQVENYKKSGFLPAYTASRWYGVPNQEVCDKAILNIKVPLKKEFSLTSLIDYDARIFSTPRVEFIRKWVQMPESHVLTAIDGGEIKGYGVMSKTVQGYKIAPIFANDPLVAKKICAALCKCIKDQGPVQIDTMEMNSSGSDLAKNFGLEKIFNTLRMYKGKPGSADDMCKNVYGITTLEIG